MANGAWWTSKERWTFSVGILAREWTFGMLPANWLPGSRAPKGSRVPTMSNIVLLDEDLRKRTTF